MEYLNQFEMDVYQLQVEEYKEYQQALAKDEEIEIQQMEEELTDWSAEDFNW